MALVGVELETLVFEPDAQTTRPPPCANLKTAAAHAVCYYVLALFAFINPFLLTDRFSAAFAFIILFFTRTGKIVACAFLNKFAAARVGVRSYFLEFRAAIGTDFWIYVE